MRCKKSFIGGCACAFGAGVLMSAFLPSLVLICVQGGIIIAAGVFILS